MIRAIDHMVILVDDLAAASADYAALGFTVVPGGQHADGATHNALVAFADDSYLELIAFLRPAPAHRWWRHQAAGAGLIDFALLPAAVEDDVAAARARGLPIADPVPGGRLRPDGQRVAWQIVTAPSADLPFLCGDVTPRELRVPHGASRQHANGVTGIAAVLVAVADPAASAARYRALLGSDAPGPAFALGAGAIVLADARSDAAAAERVSRRGAGPLALHLRTDSPERASTLDIARTHGVPIDLVVT